jgi:putative inorganic carbon (hco3(-)) transporter
MKADRFPISRMTQVEDSRGSVSAWLMLYVILLPVQFRLGELLNFAPSDVFLLAYLLFQSNRVRFRKGTWSVWHSLLLPVMIFSAWIGVEQSGELTRYVVANKLLGAVWLLIGYVVLSGEMSSILAIRSLARAFVASVSIVNLVSIAGFLWRPLEDILPQLNYGAGERVAGFLIDPNAFGGLLLTALLLQAVTGLCRAPLFRGPAGPLVCASLAVGLVLTFSRSAWVGLAAALIFFGAMRPIQTLKLTAILAGSGLALLGYAAYDGWGRYYAMAIRPGTIASRLDSEGAAFSSFLSRPVTGTGLGTFLSDHGLIIHNTFLWFLSECGIVGLVVVLGLTMWYFRVAVPLIRSSHGARRALIVALAVAHAGMIGVSAGIEVFYQRHWWLVMAMIAACRSCFSRPLIARVWLAVPTGLRAVSPVAGFRPGSVGLLRVD